jgi:hypothetical protein
VITAASAARRRAGALPPAMARARASCESDRGRAGPERGNGAQCLATPGGLGLYFLEGSVVFSWVRLSATRSRL